MIILKEFKAKKCMHLQPVHWFVPADVVVFHRLVEYCYVLAWHTFSGARHLFVVSRSSFTTVSEGILSLLVLQRDSNTQPSACTETQRAMTITSWSKKKLNHLQCMVFRWGHSRSRASPFYLKIKTRGFHMKTPTCLKFRPFKKREARDCESASARGRDFSLAIALMLPRPRTRTLAFSILAFFKTGRFHTRLRFKCQNFAFLFSNKKARLEIASGPNGTPYYYYLFIMC